MWNNRNKEAHNRRLRIIQISEGKTINTTKTNRRISKNQGGFNFDRNMLILNDLLEEIKKIE